MFAYHPSGISRHWIFNAVEYDVSALRRWLMTRVSRQPDFWSRSVWLCQGISSDIAYFYLPHTHTHHHHAHKKILNERPEGISIAHNEYWPAYLSIFLISVILLTSWLIYIYFIPLMSIAFMTSWFSFDEYNLVDIFAFLLMNLPCWLFHWLIDLAETNAACLADSSILL